MTTAPTNILATNKQVAIPDEAQINYSLKREIMKEINVSRPGRVITFYSEDCTADIAVAQLQVTSVKPDGTETIAPLPTLLGVPVSFQGGGGVTGTFPIKAGDECILLFNDRELENWQFTGGGQPTTARLHDLSDAYAIVGIRNKTRALANISTTTAQLRTDDGTTFAEIDPVNNIVNLTSPNVINLNAPIVNIMGVINVVNSLGVTNPCNINGTVIATGDVQSDSGGHKLNTHVHSGVQTGGGDTGGPVG